MRKVIVTNIVSLDGFCAGPDGNPMVLPMDDAFDTYNAQRLNTADTLLLGATTYGMFAGFWPSVVDDPAASDANREISRRDNEIEKLVVSDGLPAEPSGPWASTTAVVRRAEAHERIAELKRGEGRDILVFGSHRLWNDLLAHGLVDELHLIVGAVVLGAGVRAFETAPPAGLTLIDVQPLAGSQNLLARYRVDH